MTAQEIADKCAVSVVIPAVNEEMNIRGAVNSAFASGANEVIVVDGGSTDATVSQARQTQAKILVSAPGRAVQQNLGAAAATGHVVLFLHADCRLAKGCVPQIRTAVQRGFVHGAFRQAIDGQRLIYRLIAMGNGLRARWMRMPYGDQGIFVRKQSFDAIGGFPEVTIMEDVLIRKRLARFGPPVLLPGPIIVSARRWETAGPVRQTLRNWSLLGRLACGVTPEQLARRYPRHDTKQRSRTEKRTLQ